MKYSPCAYASLLSISFLSAACVSLTKDNDGPPVITEATPIEEALALAIEYGGDTLLSTKDMLEKKRQWLPAAEWLSQEIRSNIEQWNDRTLIHANNLYQACNDPESPELFKFLVNTKRGLAHELGWYLAASQPSAKMKANVEDFLSSTLEHDILDMHLMPAMAEASMANQLTSSYSILREGLFEKGNPEFAQAMIGLDSKQASEDFLNYLAQVEFEDLRQISIPKINLMTTTVIFEHYLNYPPNIGNRNFTAIFLYSVSRNRPLADMATTVISNYLPAQTRTLALLLSAMESPVQLAVLENIRRNLTSEFRLFIEELKMMTAKKEVVDEINSLL